MVPCAAAGAAAGEQLCHRASFEVPTMVPAFGGNMMHRSVSMDSSMAAHGAQQQQALDR